MFSKEVNDFRAHYGFLIFAYMVNFPIFLWVLNQQLLDLPMLKISLVILQGQVAFFFFLFFYFMLKRAINGNNPLDIVDWLCQWDHIKPILFRTMILVSLMVMVIFFQLNSKLLFNQFLLWDGVWDRLLQDFDIWVFGAHPWQIVTSLLSEQSTVRFIRFLDLVYIYWFSIQWLAIYDAAFLAPSELRNKTLMNYIIIWFIGTETGGFIYSGGPFFYALDPHNLSQANFLHQIHEVTPLFCYKAQLLLWDNFLVGGTNIRLGISAFPSLHVAISYFIFLYCLDRQKFRVISFIFFLVIWVGSSVLGWHYMADGFGAIILVHVARFITNCIFNINQKMSVVK
ncbi:MAG: hypothetical protein CMF42_05140 [Legionellales bacterium]|nr:hypothetical protein [Legionellales bacterium]OUX67066.1 MAG: hypothetical protein CBD38_03485 [bacterium TMED178]|tara:strand:+ start:1909 stop:2931 length:1023 start_codon:yes stop_codon:yes gene_type:complete